MRNKRRILVLEAGGCCGISVVKLLKRNNIGTVIAADMDPFSPTLSLSDIALVIPPTKGRGFTKAIKSIIEKFNVDVILPTFEHGFEELATLNDERFVTDFFSAMLCKNKYNFSKKCEEIGLPVPATYKMESLEDIESPMYIKPNKGVGSRNNYIANSNSEFQRIKKYISCVDDFIVQEFLTGTHWNVDVLVLDNKFIVAIPRRDIKQKGGNCITVSVENNNGLVEFSKKVHKKLDIKSPFNLEVFERNGIYTINEINVRFGGGVIFGALSGVDIVSYTVTRDIKFLGKLREGIYSRYYEEIEIKKDKKILT
ncbi:MAG: ATP-grasp domain-containing protein [Patescibacteria group bacterium]